MAHRLYIEGDWVIVQDDGSFLVQSRTDKETWYEVIPDGMVGGPCCDPQQRRCKGYEYRGACRHLSTISKLKKVQAPVPRPIKVKGGAPIERWTNWAEIFGTDGIPEESAVVIRAALRHALKEDDVSADAPWQLVEFLCADYVGAVRL